GRERARGWCSSSEPPKGPRLRRSGRPRTKQIGKEGKTATAPPEVRPAAARVESTTTGRARSSPLSPLAAETDFFPTLPLHHAGVLDDDLDRAVADLGEREPQLVLDATELLVPSLAGRRGEGRQAARPAHDTASGERTISTGRREASGSSL